MRPWSKYLPAFLGFTLGFFAQSLAQQQVIPLQKQFQTQFEKSLLGSTQVQHVGFLPLIQSEVPAADSSISSIHFDQYTNRSWWARKAFKEHLIQYDSNGVQFSLDPLVNLEYSENRGNNPRDVQLFKNMRGFILRLNLGMKFSVESSFRENQVFLPSYLHQRTRINRVAYGQGRVKQFNEDGFDFAMASSIITYKPNDRFYFQAGHSKHFIGYGQRSLLLSDLAFNYPFFKVTSNWMNGKIQYQNMYTLFQDISVVETDFESEGLLERKRGSFHYLDFALSPKFNIALFEGMIWPSLDSGGNVNVPVNYYLPVLFLNSLLDGDADQGNSLLGLNWAWKANRNTQVYGQGSSLGFEADEYSYQFGANYYPNFLPLRFNVEYNKRADLNSASLFHHYGESLTSPAPSASDEILASVVFHYRRHLSQLGANQIQLKGEEVQFIEFMQAFIINPKTNLSLKAGLRYRMDSVSKDELNLFYFGLSTNLQNLYFNY